MNNFRSVAYQAPISTADAVLRAGVMTKDQGRRMLGITGFPGAGKSTLAEQVVAAVPDAVLVPMDGFHLAQAVLDDAGLAGRKGAPETFDRHGFAALLQRLRNQAAHDPPVYAPTFRRDIEEPVAGAIAVPWDCSLVVTEGNYLLHWPEVRALLDEVWWVEIDRDERLRRLTARHEAYGKSAEQASAWARGSDEQNAALIAPGRELADIVVAGG
jgi:pantothenate kinase